MGGKEVTPVMAIVYQMPQNHFQKLYQSLHRPFIISEVINKAVVRVLQRTHHVAPNVLSFFSGMCAWLALA
jgi:hypothetical protein